MPICTLVQPSRRTLAFGIVSAAGSVGTMLTAPIAAYLLNHEGWRAGLWAYAILAIAMLPAAWIGTIGQNPRKGTTHTRQDVADELGDVAFTALVAAASLGYDPREVLARVAAKVRSRLNTPHPPTGEHID